MPPDSATENNAEAAQAAPAAAPKTAAEVVTEWFNGSIQGSEVARNTPVYNALLPLVEDLKARLDGFTK